MTEFQSEARQWALPDETATGDLARRLASALEGGLVMYLLGPLGAGKTSFTRALLAELGVGERIKSPTYSLIEGYSTLAGWPAWHLDLYRIADPGELEWLGLDVLSEPAALVLIEWPERGAGSLPAADLEWNLAYRGDGRQATVRALTRRGEQVLDRLA